MKRALKIAALSFLSLMTVLLVVGFLLPGTVALETTGPRMEASRERVWPFLAHFDGISALWGGVSAESGVSMELVHKGGPVEGAGLEIDFVVDGRVFESWRVVVAEPTRVVIEVDFQVFVVERTLTLREESAGTVVHWRETGETKNPLMRFLFLLSSEADVIANFDRALAVLKAVAEDA